MIQLPKEPLISIIALNWNQLEVTCQFLESTRLFTYKNYEILIIDNGSKEDPTAYINAQQYPNTRVLRSEVNLGFTGGNNWGMREAKGEYYFIVNNDTEVTDNLLEALLEPFFMDEKIGVSGPKIRYFEPRDMLQYVGFGPINPYTGRTFAVGYQESDHGQYDVGSYTHGAHGGAMMVKKEVVDKVGMFPEKFFIYYEEWDWCLRILRAGYKIYYTPKGLIYHKESVTMGKESAIKAYYHTRNRIMLMRRNVDMMHFIVFLLFFCFLTAPKFIFNYIRKGQWQHLKSFFKAIGWNLTHSKQSAS